METLTLEKKGEWVESSQTKVFDIDPNTHQVGMYLYYPCLIRLGDIYLQLHELVLDLEMNSLR